MKKTHLTTEDLADFFAEFCLLRQSEIPEKEALKMLLEGQDKKSVQHFITTLINATDLLSGLELFSDNIPEYIFALLRQSKKNNADCKILTDIADHLSGLTLTDTGVSYQQKLKNSLVYPTTILVIVSILTTIMLIFVMPVFADMFKSFGTELPALTQLFINLSNYLQQYFEFVLIVILAAVVYFSSSYSRLFKSKLLLQLPAIGRVVRSIESAVILKTVHLLCSYQFSLAEALRLSAGASQNAVVIAALTESADKITKGEEFIESLQPASIFSAKTRRLLALFAKTQQLQILKNLACYHHKLISTQTALSLRLLNVVLLLGCWLIVGAMVIAIYLPIFALGAAVG